MSVTKRKSCRVCSYKGLRQVYSFGNLAMSGFTKKPTSGKKAPLELVECEDCSLVQLRHTAPFEEMYSKHYWYKSGVNPVIVNDLAGIVKVALKMAKPKPGDVFLDLGCNDGSLFQFVPDNLTKIGVEPASNLWNEAAEHCYLVPGYWGEPFVKYKTLAYAEKKAKIITAIGMMYDAEDPGAFLGDVAEALAPDGIFIAQMMTLWPMLKNGDVGNVCHEHLEFYTYESLKRLFGRSGLEIFRVETNGINGGSYRLFARHYKKGHVDFPEDQPDWCDFVRRVEHTRETVRAYVKRARREGKKIYVYGASTKSSTILQWYGLSVKEIAGAADRNPAKWELYQVGTKIPVVSEEEARAKADVFLVMPYGFRDHFVEREAEWLRDGAHEMVFVMPKFEIVRYGAN